MNWFADLCLIFSRFCSVFPSCLPFLLCFLSLMFLACSSTWLSEKLLPIHSLSSPPLLRINSGSSRHFLSDGLHIHSSNPCVCLFFFCASGPLSSRRLIGSARSRNSCCLSRSAHHPLSPLLRLLIYNLDHKSLWVSLWDSCAWIYLGVFYKFLFTQLLFLMKMLIFVSLW